MAFIKCSGGEKGPDHILRLYTTDIGSTTAAISVIIKDYKTGGTLSTVNMKYTNSAKTIDNRIKVSYVSNTGWKLVFLRFGYLNYVAKQAGSTASTWGYTSQVNYSIFII